MYVCLDFYKKIPLTNNFETIQTRNASIVRTQLRATVRIGLFMEQFY